MFNFQFGFYISSSVSGFQFGLDVSCIMALGSTTPSVASLARIGGEVYDHFRAYRVVDGQLARARSKGIP